MLAFQRDVGLKTQFFGSYIHKNWKKTVTEQKHCDFREYSLFQYLPCQILHLSKNRILLEPEIMKS